MTGVRVFRTVILSENEELVRTIEANAGVECRRRVEDAAELAESVHDVVPELLFLDLGADPDAVLSAVEKLETPTPVFVFCGVDDSGLVRKAMRAGGREYISTDHEDLVDQLDATVLRLAAELPVQTPTRRAAVLAVMGAKGGSGATFVSCQLAAALAQGGDKVALVDGHLRMGDVALHLDLKPEYSLADLAAQAESFDATFLRTTLTAHDSGVSVLASPPRPEEADVVTLPLVERAVRLLVSDFDWVVWDIPSDFDDRSMLILDTADRILVVTTPEVPALSHTKTQLDLLGRLGRSPDTLRTILNRVDKRAPVSEKEARTFLGRDVDATLPNDYGRASACVNEGRTIGDLAGRSPLARAFAELASQVRGWCGRDDAESSQQGGGLLNRLRRK